MLGLGLVLGLCVVPGFGLVLGLGVVTVVVVVIEAVAGSVFAVVGSLWLSLKLPISPSSGNFRLIVDCNLGSECKIFINCEVFCVCSPQRGRVPEIYIFFTKVEICCVFIAGLPYCLQF